MYRLKRLGRFDEWGSSFLNPSSFIKDRLDDHPIANDHIHGAVTPVLNRQVYFPIVASLLNSKLLVSNIDNVVSVTMCSVKLEVFYWNSLLVTIIEAEEHLDIIRNPFLHHKRNLHVLN